MKRTEILASLQTEGFSDAVKKGIKNVKRGLQGWDKENIGPGGEQIGDPKDIVRRNKGYDDETVQRLHKAVTSKGPGFPFRQGDYDGKDKHSPAGLQKRVLDREMKKRGLSNEDTITEDDVMPHALQLSLLLEPETRDEAFDMLNNLREKHGKDYSSAVFNIAKKLHSNSKQYDVSEGSEDRKSNALWAQITSYEQQAKKTSNPLKKDHLLKMARELRLQLPTNENIVDPIDEAVSSKQRERLDDLISQYRNATDPEANYDDYDAYYDNSDDIISQIRSEFGDKVADQVESGTRKMHFGRDNQDHGYDALGWKEPVSRVTKAGKMYKQDSDYRKNTIKSRFKHSGHSAVRSPDVKVPEGADDYSKMPDGRAQYEEMKDRIASVLIKLYDKGNDKETIQQMGERVAKHLGYDPQDPIYKQAWMTSFTDASLNGDFDDDEFDYTDYSMRKGEMGESSDENVNEIDAKLSSFKPGQSATVSTANPTTGVTQTTTVDLKKNPTALSKDPISGKLKLSASSQPQSAAAPTNTTPKPGDTVDVSSTSDIKKLAGL